MEAHQEPVEQAPPAGNAMNERFRFRECTKNQAIAVNGYAVDGCGEFMPAGAEGSIEALHCAACHCHRNYHRREPVSQTQQVTRVYHHQPYNYHHRLAGYLHVTAPPPPPAAAHHHHHQFAQPSSSREHFGAMGNPGSGGDAGASSSKRFRTKFSKDQKAKMLAFAVEIGWRMKKEHKSDIQKFCSEIGVSSQVFKVWMHNHKNNLGKNKA